MAAWRGPELRRHRDPIRVGICLVPDRDGCLTSSGAVLHVPLPDRPATGTQRHCPWVVMIKSSKKTRAPSGSRVFLSGRGAAERPGARPRHGSPERQGPAAAVASARAHTATPTPLSTREAAGRMPGPLIGGRGTLDHRHFRPGFGPIRRQKAAASTRIDLKHFLAPFLSPCRPKAPTRYARLTG